MPLALSPRTADFIPYVKYNGQSGRWYTKNDLGEEYEVSNMTAVFDFQNIKCGWIYFFEGMAPDAVWDTGPTAGPKPSDKHKRGFAVNVFSPKELGGVREFSANANVTVDAIIELYDTYEADPSCHQGLLPVVRCVNVKPVKSKFGTNYQPEFKIMKWVPRPAAFDGKASAPVAEAVPPPRTIPRQVVPPPRTIPRQVVPPPRTIPRQVVPPPARAPVTEMADADEELF